VGHGRQEGRLGRLGPQLPPRRDELQPAPARVRRFSEPTRFCAAARALFATRRAARRFERDPTGNACDCSGYFPGEGKYKDPARPDVDFAAMMAEKEVMADIEANKKPGDVPGAPGCL
jgi:hypothetical protein